MLEKVEALIYDVEDSFQTYVKYVSHGYKKMFLMDKFSGVLIF